MRSADFGMGNNRPFSRQQGGHWGYVGGFGRFLKHVGEGVSWPWEWGRVIGFCWGIRPSVLHLQQRPSEKIIPGEETAVPTRTILFVGFGAAKAEVLNGRGRIDASSENGR